MAEQFTDHLGNPIIPKVSVVQTLKSGTKIGEINGIPLYAPQGGGNVNVTQTLLSGVEIGRINNIPLYAPSGGGGGSSSKPMDGKTILLCGDSQLGQGQDIDQRVQAIVGGTVYNLGFGGCRMSYRQADGSSTYDPFSMVGVALALTTGDFSAMDAALPNIKTDYFTNTVAELKTIYNNGLPAYGANFILSIAYSSNDFSGGVPMGDPNGYDKTTFKGAINWVVKTLLETYPRLTILLVGTPMRYYGVDASEVNNYPPEAIYEKVSQSTGVTNYYVHSDYYVKTQEVDGQQVDYKRVDYNDAILEQAKLLSIPCFDLYRRSGRNKWNVWTLCSSDGTHPTTPAGRQAAANFYAKILQTF